MVSGDREHRFWHALDALQLERGCESAWHTIAALLIEHGGSGFACNDRQSTGIRRDIIRITEIQKAMEELRRGAEHPRQKVACEIARARLGKVSKEAAAAASRAFLDNFVAAYPEPTRKWEKRNARELVARAAAEVFRLSVSDEAADFIFGRLMKCSNVTEKALLPECAGDPLPLAVEVIGEFRNRVAQELPLGNLERDYSTWKSQVPDWAAHIIPPMTADVRAMLARHDHMNALAKHLESRLGHRRAPAQIAETSLPDTAFS